MSLDRRNSSTLLLGIIGGLVAIIVLFLSYQWFFSSSSQMPPKHSEKSVANPTKTVIQATSEATLPVTDEKTNQLVDEQLVKAPIPSNESLAKEEVAKLEDVQTQLNDQAVTLKAQHTDADNLIALKEEQIKLLEAQLAQKP